MFPDGNQAIANIIMPGSHDSGTYEISRNSTFVAQCSSLPYAVAAVDRFLSTQAVPTWAKTQEDGLGPQLKAGARYFDVRPAWLDSAGTWRACHTLAGALISDMLGPKSDFQQFARSHPDEVILVDLSHIYPGDGDVAAFKTWINDALGDLAYTADSNATLASTRLSDVREAKKNVIVFGGDKLSGGIIWPRDPNLYTPWVDNSEAAIKFWSGDYGSAQISLTEREKASLKAPNSKDRLTVLNYIWDSGCPTPYFSDAHCGLMYAAPGSLISWTRSYLIKAMPGFVTAVNREAKRQGGRGFVVMRDITAEGSNAPIWEANP